MSQQHSIDAIPDDELSPAFAPLMHEILAALGRLVDHNQRHVIDLRALPLAPGDDERIEAFLGRGEVSATLNALGHSEFQETRYAGVWLINHFNADGQTVGRLIEIAPLPELLTPPVDDLGDSRAALAEALQDSAKRPNDNDN